MTASVVATTLCFVFLPQALILLSTQQGRKNAYVVVETVLASVLVLLLLTIVLGLPIGAPNPFTFVSLACHVERLSAELAMC